MANGLRVIFQHVDTPVAYCGYAVDAGTRDEDAEKPGMAHFIEHMVFKGTERRRSWHILNRMENVGGDLNAYTAKEETVVYCSFMAEHLERAVDLLSDLVFHSVFPDVEISKETEVIIDEINSYLDSPSELIFDDFEDIIFSGHPLGRNILGNPESLKSYRHADAADFHSRMYRPDNMVFFVLGDYDFSHILSCLEKSLDGVSSCGSPLLRTPPTSYKPRRVFARKDTHQAHVMVGGRAFNGTSSKRVALNLITNILGGPGMNSRLNLALREHSGLVYDIEANYTPYTDAGTFCIYFGCDREDIHRCLDKVHAELRRMCQEKLTPLRLSAAKKQLIGQIGVASDNNENNALGMGKTFLHYNRFVTSAQAFDAIEKLTAETIQDAANEVLNPDILSTLVFSH